MVVIYSREFHICDANSFCPASFHETCQWLKFPLNGLRAQSRVSPAVGLLPLASGPACLGMAFPPFLMKQLYCCDWVVISSFVGRGYTVRRWGWLLGRIGYSQGRIKLFGPPRQWKHFRPLFQAVFLSEGVLPPRLSQTPRLPVPRQK